MRLGRSRKATTVTRPGRGPRDGCARREAEDLQDGLHQRRYASTRPPRAAHHTGAARPPARSHLSRAPTNHFPSPTPDSDSPSLDTLSRTPSTGSVVNRRTRMRPSILTDMFWSVVNLIAALCVPALAPSPDLARVFVSAAPFRRADTRLSLLAVSLSSHAA